MSVRQGVSCCHMFTYGVLKGVEGSIGKRSECGKGGAIMNVATAYADDGNKSPCKGIRGLCHKIIKIFGTTRSWRFLCTLPVIALHE